METGRTRRSTIPTSCIPEVNTGVNTRGQPRQRRIGRATEPGSRGYGNDSHGFGQFPDNTGSSSTRNSQSSRGLRNFKTRLWRDMPGICFRRSPTGAHGIRPRPMDMLRVKSKNHCDVAMRVGDKVIHILASHPTPPAPDKHSGPRRALRGPRRPSPRRSRDHGPGGCGGGARAPRGSVPAPRRGRDRPGSTSLLRLLATAGNPRRGELLRDGTVLRACGRYHLPGFGPPSPSSPASQTLPGAAGAALPGGRPGAGLGLDGGGTVRGDRARGRVLRLVHVDHRASTTSPVGRVRGLDPLGLLARLGGQEVALLGGLGARSSSSRAIRPCAFTTAP